MPKLSLAIAAWSRILGSEWVETEKVNIQSVETTTFLTKQAIHAIIQPKNAKELSACLKIANQYRIPVYTISGGKNWGYGSKVPVHASSVLIDLKRMNRIIDLNKKMAYVVMEPGVTQAELLAYLEDKTSGRLWLDTVASSPHTSLIGNAMERGHGTTPYCDRIAHCANFQVVLANGDIVETGYGIFKNCKTKNLDAWGVGPALSHLFSQSNLGIVTRMTLMLYPRPETTKIVLFKTDSDSQLGLFIDWANQQVLKGVLKAGPHILNHYISLIRLLGEYPWEAMAEQTPLKEEMALLLSQQHKISKWTAIFGLWGTQLEVQALQEEVRKTFPEIGTLEIWEEQEIIDDKNLSDMHKKDLLNLFKQLSGKITGMGLKRAYWRNKKAKPNTDNIADIDIDKDRCGFLSINPCSPMAGEDFLSIASMATKIILDYGFEPNISAYGTRPRLLQCHITICFDRDNPHEDKQALDCQNELIKALQEKGYYSGRLNIASMDQMKEADPAYLALLRAIKEAMDKHHILSPGRYDAPVFASDST